MNKPDNNDKKRQADEALFNNVRSLSLLITGGAAISCLQFIFTAGSTFGPLGIDMFLPFKFFATGFVSVMLFDLARWFLIQHQPANYNLTTLILTAAVLVPMTLSIYGIRASSEPLRIFTSQTAKSTTPTPTPVHTITDGDTIRIGEERIRIIGLDTPEVFKPQCLAEKMLGDRATVRLGEILASGTMTLDRKGLDKYKRTLAVVSIDDKDVAPVMIAEGLAMKRRPKEGWCAPPVAAAAP